jgi:hypothetical protein
MNVTAAATGDPAESNFVDQDPIPSKSRAMAGSPSLAPGRRHSDRKSTTVVEITGRNVGFARGAGANLQHN